MNAQTIDFEAVAEGNRAGRTLPTAWYTDAGLFELERRLIFGRSGQYVGGASQVAEPGDYFTSDVAGTPVVLVRGQDGELRAFLNICRHRHHPVAEGCGNRRLFTCFYHAWTYALDGTLVRAPRSEESPGFESAGLGLHPVGVAAWGDMLFVDISRTAPPLEETLGAAREVALQRGLPIAAARFRGRRSMEVDANWKLVWDNNCECYHCPTVHARWNSQVRLDPEHYWDRRIGPYHYETELALIEGRPSQFAYYAWPSLYFQSSDTNYSSGTGFAGTPDRKAMVILRFAPLAVRRTRVDVDIYHVDEIDPPDVERRLDQVFSVVLEDKSVCERMQQAHDSGAAGPGTLLKGIDTEDHTLLWQQLIHRSISSPDTPLYAPPA
jgi:phenylpropionate dioxygenase-like ring-hydroxylating dioxygenase large terminal subunit